MNKLLKYKTLQQTYFSLLAYIEHDSQLTVTTVLYCKVCSPQIKRILAPWTYPEDSFACLSISKPRPGNHSLVGCSLEGECWVSWGSWETRGGQGITGLRRLRKFLFWQTYEVYLLFVFSPFFRIQKKSFLVTLPYFKPLNRKERRVCVCVDGWWGSKKLHK